MLAAKTMTGTLTPPPQKYAAHTQQGFLLREVTFVASRMNEGETPEAIRREVMDDDAFQLPSRASRTTALTAVTARLNGVTPTLLGFLAEGSHDLRRLSNFYLILVHHRLLRDFVAEVLLEALSRMDATVTAGDIRAFMVYKRDQVPEIASWSEATADKARSSLVNVCVHAGLLEKAGKNWIVRPQYVPQALREELIQAGRPHYLRSAHRWSAGTSTG
jgi:hypothetical protein